MRYFGIDPGSRITGYGVIENIGSNIRYIDAGIIKTKIKGTLSEKLEIIYNGLKEKLIEFSPDFVSVEEAFYAKNVHTTLVLGHARGVALLAAQKVCAKVVEYSPRKIKKSVVGNGNATKEQVEYMVRVILGLTVTDKNVSFDMYDALAAAICAFNNTKRVG